MTEKKYMKALRLHAIGDLRTDAVPVPEISGEELLLRVSACGICGSDIPRVYEQGTSNGKYPLTIGHEFSGTIVAAGEKADPALLGARCTVFPLIPCRRCNACLMGNYAMCSHYDYLGSRRDGGFAEYVKIPSRWHLVISRNPDISLDTLCMTEPACVAQHAIRKSGLTAGQSVVIYGAGPIGILAARWASVFGAGHVLLADVEDGKVAFAKELGLEAVNALKTDPAGRIAAMNGGRPADAAIEGTGAGSALEGCIRCVKASGSIVMLGNPHGDTVIDLQAHGMILRKELRISGTWNSNFSPYPINEWEYTVRMMDEKKLRTDDLITHRSKLDDLPALFEKIHHHEITLCKAVYSAGTGVAET